MLRRTLTLIMLIIGLGAFSGCYTLMFHSRWSQAESKDTIEAYENYLRHRSKGEFADKAKSRLEVLYYQKAKSKHTITDYTYFLKRFPKSDYKDVVRHRLEPLLLEKARSSSKISVCEDYLKMYAGSEHVDEIRSLLDLLVFHKAVATHTVTDYEKILKKYPNSRFSDDIKAKLMKLKIEMDKLEREIKRVLPSGVNVEITSESRYPLKPELLITAHLLDGYSPDNDDPLVKGDYGDNLKLAAWVQNRCARILKTIAHMEKLPSGSQFTVRVKHGVEVEYRSAIIPLGKPIYSDPSNFLSSYPSVSLGSSNEAMMIYEVSLSMNDISKLDRFSLNEKTIREMWDLNKNRIPELQFRPVSTTKNTYKF